MSKLLIIWWFQETPDSHFLFKIVAIINGCISVSFKNAVRVFLGKMQFLSNRLALGFIQAFKMECGYLAYTLHPIQFVGYLSP